MPVDAGEYHDFLFGHEVEDAIGESAEESTPNVAMDDCERKRVAFDGVEPLIKRLEELVTKVVTSVAVPRENTFDVRLRRGREAEVHFLRVKESRTSDQGRTALGSLKWSARRRSSSLR